MEESKLAKAAVPPLGGIEPHAALLGRPAEDQRLYKVMRVEDLLSSISGAYLHFNRVDSYKDFEGADGRDGQQLPQDRQGNTDTAFLKAPNFTAADYYDQCRGRTYACCFSVENSDYIWRNYGNGGERGKVCVVFEFGKLRKTLNTTLEASNSALEFDGLRCHQIFSINYGLVEYVEWETHQANAVQLPNPIKYTYLKEKTRFGEEKELRISLSAIGMGRFVLNGGREMPFPAHLHAAFDFREAIADGTIAEILCAPDCDSAFFRSELQRLGIEAKPS